MYFTFKKNNKQTKKPINRFLQDGVSAGLCRPLLKENSAKVDGTDFTYLKGKANKKRIFDIKTQYAEWNKASTATFTP